MGDIADSYEHVDPEVAALEADVAAARAEAAKLRARLKAQDRELAGYRQAAQILNTKVKAPKWARRKRQPRGEHRATAVAVLSDTHFDEVVNPDELDGLNAYNREIAGLRLERFFDRIPWLAKSHLDGLTYDGIVLPVLGDLVSGNLHDLQETNDAYLPDTVSYWPERIASGIEYLADEFGRVHVPWIVGNHGRLTRKPRTKGRVRDNLDWLLGQLVSGALTDERITFDIPDSTDVLVPVYDYTILCTHGDQASGGQGIAGIWPPLFRMLQKKRVRAAFDLLLMGHFHQLIPPATGLGVNGALKGYDEFAAVNNFRPEPAQQMFFTVVPEHGVTWSAPIRVADRKAEGW